MKKLLLTVLLVTAVSESIFAQQKDNAAILKLLKDETVAYYNRDSVTWASYRSVSADARVSVIDNLSYRTVNRGDSINNIFRNIFRQSKPIKAEVTIKNPLIRTNGDLAYAEYEQNIDYPSGDSMQHHSTYEKRALVKENGKWVILSQTTADANSFKSNSATNIEAQLNMAGYRLLASNRVDDAIEVFKMNVKLFPKAFNAYDSLGEAYSIAGNKELAIENYETSVKLNPDNENAKTVLKKLKGK
jgi:tetratricopeptide (TPR) repeat protein